MPETTVTQTLCGRCNHPMHWHECGAGADSTGGPCPCRNDVDTVSELGKVLAAALCGTNHLAGQLHESTPEAIDREHWAQAAAIQTTLAAQGWRLVNVESLAAALRECDPSDDGNAPLDEVGALAYFDRKASRYLAALP
jgi:hypothetical protein